ncbi:hypothetical protein NCAST_06_00010 [Nocardia asteroides NBRC 15531]|uniref:Uncharacterized protein n=1 Tax=Nocardia asteroides NBRC 15531 TaxID=1110697 RepID=U5EAA2_NOCAS|nr:hypothetical protein NCAST_06_00010 [Nocardia asteroides NBRC 15531]
MCEWVFGVFRRSDDVQYSTVRQVARPLVGVLPMALAVACAGVAVAVPQPGINPEQPGVTTPADEGGRSDLAKFDNPDTLERLTPDRPESRPVPEYTAPAPPIVIEELHLPEPVEPVAPIAPPPRTLRVGDFTSPVPDEVPGEVLDGVNGTAADVEAAIATQGRSIGINPSRSDKIAAATVGGALAGAALAGVPAAAVGAVGGGLIGAGIGAGVGFAVGAAGTAGATAILAGAAAIPTAGAGALPTIAGGFVAAWPIAAATTGAGAAIGAGVGAAVGAAALGIPAAAAGAVAGGVLGSGYGATI